MLILWLVASVIKMQGALHWWVKRQSDQRWLESDRIRNRLLQDTFAMRRSLELSLANDSLESPQARQDWLDQVERLHYSLEALSDALTPPYLEDSLPLALQVLVKSWRVSYPDLNIGIELPSTWTSSSPHLHQTVLTAVDELLKIALSVEPNPVIVQIDLQTKRQLGKLNVQITYPNYASLISLYRSKDLAHLAQVFQVLTSGRCWQRQHYLTLLWQFSWRLPSPSEKSQSAL